MAKNVSTIQVEVTTDENNVPERIHWSAKEGGVDSAEAKAMILSFWDDKAGNAMRIDIWDREMTVEEMKIFFHQTLLTMADSFERATNEKNMMDDLRDYCHHFGTKMGIIG